MNCPTKPLYLRALLLTLTLSSLALSLSACSGSGLQQAGGEEDTSGGVGFGVTDIGEGDTSAGEGTDDDATEPDADDQAGDAAAGAEVLEDAAAGPPDTGEPAAGGFVTPCATNDDCFSGLCVDHLGTKVCTKACDSDCPAGWECTEISLGGQDVTWACISDYTHLCRPCASKADCTTLGVEDVCVVYGDQGSFCGAGCDDDDACPDGYSCDVVDTTSGATTKQCVADAGVCVCSDAAIDLALTTPCYRESEAGTCDGIRTCTPDGLSACNAAVASVEECNGLDDDCDGDTDNDAGELICDDGNDCTEDSCDPALGCQYVPTPGGGCDDGDVCSLADHCEGDVCVGSAIDCDDGNPCTGDSCNPTGGCIYTFNVSSCDDGDACTVQDACQQGDCVGAALECECEVDSDCLVLEDDDVCNGTLTCDTTTLPWRCAVDEDTIVTCPDPEGLDAPCLTAVCDAFSGECSEAPASDGALCDDGDACSVAAQCDDGACGGGLELNCEDGNPCTDDACDPATGCTHVDNNSPCSDGDTCTSGDTCAAGQCVGGADIACDDGNPCTADSCDPASGCSHAAAPGECDDGNACTTGDTCIAGACTFGGILACPTDTPCVAATCEPAVGCVETNVAGPCSDGDPCTVGDACDDGVCLAGTPLGCDDDNPCTADSCVAPGDCQHLADDTADCTDGNACTDDDSCLGGSCVGATQVSCEDGDPCTDHSCDSADGCETTFNTADCDDGEPCTASDTCAGGLCEGVSVDCECQLDTDCAGLDDNDLCTGTLVCDTTQLPYQCVVAPGSPVTCPDPDGVNAPCLTASCDPLSGDCDFEAAADGGSCDDGDACTMADTCLGGTCTGGPATSCDDGNPCTDDSCDATAGCSSVPNLDDCDDGNACTTAEQCSGGSCVASLATDCDDLDPCTDDLCDPTSGCTPTPNTAPCSDDDPCTLGDTCLDGDCTAGVALECDDANPCTADACVAPGVCQHLATDAVCSDNNPCTESDTCIEGQCIGLDLVDCDDTNVCTDEWCSVADGGCQYAANEAPCTDLDPCTDVDVCSNEQCVPGAPLDCDDDEVCTDDDCDPEIGCTWTANEANCDDDNACTEGDLCADSECLSGDPIICTDANDCTANFCDTVNGCSTLEEVDGTPCSEVTQGACLDGECVCEPECSGVTCGPDGCGGSCGVCQAPDECIAGACECIPDCGDAVCGANGCGGDCGTCSGNQICTGGACIGLPCGNSGTSFNGGCVWTQTGADTFNVPAGVSSVTVTLIGGGGGAGTSFYYPGGGGGSGTTPSSKLSP